MSRSINHLPNENMTSVSWPKVLFIVILVWLWIQCHAPPSLPRSRKEESYNHGDDQRQNQMTDRWEIKQGHRAAG